MLPEFNAPLDEDVPQARCASCKLLDGRIKFDASSGSYVLTWRTRVGAPYTPMVPRKGLEPPQCCHR